MSPPEENWPVFGPRRPGCLTKTGSSRSRFESHKNCSSCFNLRPIDLKQDSLKPSSSGAQKNASTSTSEPVWLKLFFWYLLNCRSINDCSYFRKSKTEREGLRPAAGVNRAMDWGLRLSLGSLWLVKPFKSELSGAKRNLVVLATNQATSASNLHSIQSTTPKKLRPAGVIKN